MDLTNRSVVQELLRKHDILPRRHWGQNFLVSPSVLAKIFDAAAVAADETILEVGGGLGALTMELAKRAKKVVVIERDPKLFAVLIETFASYKNVELRCEDARELDMATISRGPYRFIASLPYSVGTIVLRRILESDHPPQESFLIVQREVAERIAARPPHMHLLSIAMQILAEPKVLFRIPAGAMWPVPQVESALLSLKTKPRHARKDYEMIMSAARRGFAHPRKYVLPNISRDQNIRETLRMQCHIPPRARAQELTHTQWKCLASSLREVE